MSDKPRQRFLPDELQITTGARQALTAAGLTGGTDYLRRHLTGDWGDLCDEDKMANEAALLNDGQLLSAFALPDGTAIWAITDSLHEPLPEAAPGVPRRKLTTLLLPDEY